MKKQHLHIPSRAFLLRTFVAAILGTALIFAANNANAQNVIKDEHGNLHAKPREVSLRDSTTGKTFTDIKGQVHPVYKGAKGALYYGQTSKSGNYYRRYLKED